MDHLIQKCPFKTPNALYQIYRMPHSMAVPGVSVPTSEKSRDTCAWITRTSDLRFQIPASSSPSSPPSPPSSSPSPSSFPHSNRPNHSTVVQIQNAEDDETDAAAS